MKIGLYILNHDLSSGGGYTFEHEIMQAVSRLTPDSHHKATVFFENPASDNIAQANLPEELVDSVFLKPLPLHLRIRRGIPRRILKYSGLEAEIIRVCPGITPLNLAAKERGIEVLWFPTPVFQPVQIPYIATVWDIEHRIKPWFPEISANGEWEMRESYFDLMLRKAAYIITGTRAGQEEISYYYQVPPERIHCVPFPAPVIDHLPSREEIDSVLEKYQITSPYLIYPAQFWAHKNHVNLLLSMRILKDQYGLDLQLVLPGSDKGNKKHVENRINELGLQNMVKLPGFITREELTALYCGAFALSFASLFGPDNLPPLEAFACKCPVIASRVSGSEEQLGDAAILVDPNNPLEIAMAVKNLYDNPALRDALVQKGEIRASRFDPNNYVRTVFSILDEFEHVRRNWGN